MVEVDEAVSVHCLVFLGITTNQYTIFVFINKPLLNSSNLAGEVFPLCSTSSLIDSSVCSPPAHNLLADPDMLNRHYHIHRQNYLYSHSRRKKKSNLKCFVDWKYQKKTWIYSFRSLTWNGAWFMKWKRSSLDTTISGLSRNSKLMEIWHVTEFRAPILLEFFFFFHALYHFSFFKQRFGCRSVFMG